MCCFQALQRALVAREISERRLNALKGMEMEHGGYRARIQALVELADSRLKAFENLQQEFDNFAAQVKTLESEMHEEALKTVNQQVMKARVETMLEFQRGECSAADVADSMRIYNDAYPKDAFIVGALEGNGDVSKKKSFPGGQ